LLLIHLVLITLMSTGKHMTCCFNIFMPSTSSSFTTADSRVQTVVLL
jgi:hypothetical protein